MIILKKITTAIESKTIFAELCKWSRLIQCGRFANEVKWEEIGRKQFFINFLAFY
jgi:hypothetical protein